MNRFVVFSLAAFALLASAAGAQVNPPEAMPDGTDRPVAAQDVLSIVIVGETGLPTDFRVSASGTIQFPFLDVVEVKGLTPRELSQKLESELSKDYFVKPQVLVTVKEYRQDYVRVMGAVNRPGPVPLNAEQRMDILDAIAFANGVTRSASDKVEFTRNGRTQTFKIETLKRETDPQKKIYLQPGDTIMVRESVF